MGTITAKELNDAFHMFSQLMKQAEETGGNAFETYFQDIGVNESDLKDFLNEYTEVLILAFGGMKLTLLFRSMILHGFVMGMIVGRASCQ